jgi:transcriptional regulator with XRE-family HTH domain
MSTIMIGVKLRKLREENELPLRKVAALLDIDVAILSKMERGERPLSKEVVMKLAKIYKHDEEELTVLFLSQRIMNEVGEEDLALKAMQVAEEQIKYQRKQKAKNNGT